MCSCVNPVLRALVSRKSTKARILLGNVGVFASCETSVDATNAAARALAVPVDSLLCIDVIVLVPYS